MSAESYELPSLRNAIITQSIHVIITFIFVGIISFRTLFVLLPASPYFGVFLLPFITAYLIFGFIYLNLLILWIRWQRDLGYHKRGLLMSSLVLAITSLIPPLLFGLIPAVLIYTASSRVKVKAK